MKKELWFCDGCGKRLQPAEINVRWSGVASVPLAASETLALGGPYDLCLSCTDRLESNVNPKQWERITEVVPPTRGPNTQ